MKDLGALARSIHSMTSVHLHSRTDIAPTSARLCERYPEHLGQKPHDEDEDDEDEDEDDEAS
jgi:hypothetical protein